jgi:Holliday junction resolvasome RuvABC DNA-binding subunit
MQTTLIQKLKNYLNKNNNKLIILNKHQISYFFRKNNSSAFNWLKTGQHLIIMFHNFDEAICFFEQEIAQQLFNFYKLITISYKGVYLNLL